MASTYDKERALQRDIRGQVEGTLPGVEVLAVELAGPERFTVYVDRAEGVDHALCQRVTDVLRDYLREYTVDVSSPGLERPLRTPKHFARALGRRVSLRLDGDVEGRRRFRGEVVAARAEAVTVKTDGADPVDIPYGTIVRGNLIDEG